ncbi:MAG TPA: efflux RND transporter periplasmic adaptor subunit [Tenuifilaceae bacterium]|nr:efflux RND transporter periplasmic adaptor subunit [Tenuifilaceae bacterium]
MKTARTLLILSFSALIASCTGNKTEVTGETKQAEVRVSTQPVEIQKVEHQLRLPATVQAYKENHLAPATAGRVEKVLVDVGDRVRAGQVVAILDRTSYQQAKIQFDKLSIDMARMDSLLKVGAVPQQQYDQVKMQYDISKTNLQFLDDNTTLKSPIDGVITGKYINDGEMFAMTPVAGIGKAAIVSIMQLDRLKLLVGVSSSYLSKIELSSSVLITTEVFPGEKFNGKIEKIYPTIDNLTKTFTIEVVVPNRSNMLRPGMFATAFITIGSGNSILIPGYVIQKQSGTNERYVFTYSDGKAVRKVIEVGEVFDDKIEITSGLNPGDELIVVGQANLMDGQAVTKI